MRARAAEQITVRGKYPESPAAGVACRRRTYFEAFRISLILDPRAFASCNYVDADKRHRGGAAGGQMVNTGKKVYDQNLRDQNFSLQPRVEDYFNKRSAARHGKPPSSAESPPGPEVATFRPGGRDLQGKPRVGCISSGPFQT